MGSQNANNLAGQGSPGGSPKSPQNFQPPTNPPQQPKIPPGYTSRPGKTPGSTIYEDPTGKGNTFRVMPPTPDYPRGYWVETNRYNQGIDPSTGKPGRSENNWHIPLP